MSRKKQKSASLASAIVDPQKVKREDLRMHRLHNGDEFRKLFNKTGLSFEEAVRVFNYGLVRPISLSTFKSWLSASESVRRRGMPDASWIHAKEIFNKVVLCGGKSSHLSDFSGASSGAELARDDLEESLAQRFRNGDAFRALLGETGLFIEEAFVLFNKGLIRPVSLSAFKAWIAAPESTRRRGMPDAAWQHANIVFASMIDDNKSDQSRLFLDLQESCGVNFKYRDFIKNKKLRGKRSASDALIRLAFLDLASKILDPVVQYFGPIKIVRGLSLNTGLKSTLKSEAQGGAQWSVMCACEHVEALICERGGVACDFLVEDEDMYEVAQWIIQNLPFDKMYFFGPEKPLHISYSSVNQRLAYIMVPDQNECLTSRVFK